MLRRTLSLLSENKFYMMMVTLMTGVTLGLVLASYWISIQRGTIKVPDLQYDYIIVGGGTAGCVLATQLSANPNNKVLLVEAGKHFSWLATIPLATPMLQGSHNDWAYRTVPQIHSSWGLINQSSAWPRGLGLGGSGQMNYLLHYTGSEEDFALWGEDEWSYNQLQPYINKMMGWDEGDSCSDDYHGLTMSAFEIENMVCESENLERKRKQQEKKRMQVESVDPLTSELAKAFLNAEKELAKEIEGIKFTSAQSTIYRGQRWSSLDAYLRPILGRHNLHILLGTHVNRVLTNQKDGIVSAEAVVVEGFDRPVYSKGNIILCAGAINTPQILMLSGIGPRDELQRLGIPLVAELPVGENLHDHLNMPLYVSLEAPVSVTIDKVQRLRQLVEYMVYSRGVSTVEPPLIFRTLKASDIFVGFLASSAIVGVGSVDQRLGLVLFGLGSADETILSSIANYKIETFRTLFPFSRNSSQEGFVLLTTCLQPISRGTITLKDTNSKSKPVIDPQYLSKFTDVQCTIDAVKLAMRMVDTEAFRELGAKVHLPHFSECAHLNPLPDDDMYLECIIRTAAITGYHPAGTCKMGSLKSKDAVVDHTLRVHGVHNLRVLDASVMPTPVSGHPNSILIAMAEKIADLILQK